MILWHKTGRRGNAATRRRSRKGVLSVVDASDVRVVQNVKRFPDELQGRSLSDSDVAAESWVERHSRGQVKTVAADSGRAIRCEVSIIVKIKIKKAGIGLP